MKTLYLDFETQSRASLRKTGAYRYAASPSTSAICAGWALVDHGAPAAPPGIVLWTRDAAQLAGLDLLGGNWSPDHHDFLRHAQDPDCRLVAHNAEFERQVLLEKYRVRVPLSRISCTAARSARLSLPRSLEAICVALGLDEEKDVDGHRVLMKLSRPRRPSKDDRDEFWSETRKPEDYARVYDYCIQDVRAMIAVDLQLPELSDEERALWELTVEMNERGVAADLEAVRAALDICERERAEMKREFLELTGENIGHAPSAARALGLRDVQKATVRDALKRPALDAKVRRAAQLRQRYAKASVDKLKAFLQRADGDGRVRGSLTYCGAERTNRWSGSGIQPQNFPRGMGRKTDEAFEALRAGALDLISDDVVKTISDMLKGFIVGPLLVGDFAQVEARLLAWLAGQENLLELFRSGGDPYCDLGSDIFGRKVTKADEKERFLGKQGVLSSGYGIGWRHFKALLDKQHDVQLTDDMAKKAVYTYRRKYPRVPALWSRIERAAIFTVQNKSTRVRASAGGMPRVFMGMATIHGRPFLKVELPSGRALHYAYPELVESGFADNPLALQFLGRNPWTHQWEMTTAYGGMLVGHAVQSLARDAMGDALLRLKARKLPLVLTVHDEAVAEGEDLRAFKEEMDRAPAWAEGAPLAAECYTCLRYRKN